MTDGIERTPPDLLHFISMEENQLLVSLVRMKDIFAAVSQIEGLYSAAMTYKSVKPDDFVVFQLLTFTHYQFLFSMACQMRCHLSEAFGAARAGIDAALIAAYIIRDRAAQTAYAKREKPFDNFARHLGNLIKDGKELPHPLMPVLIDQQKKISAFAVHGDVGSFVHRANRSDEGGQTMMTFEYFQFSRNDDERKVHTLTLFHTFVMVLDVFADFLVTEQKVVPLEWKEQLHRLGGKIERHARQLREALGKSAGDAAAAPAE